MEKRIPAEFMIQKTKTLKESRALLDRCNSFLEKIKNLEQDANQDLNIENISSDQEQVIEMDLHLGIFDVLEKDQDIKYKREEEEDLWTESSLQQETEIIQEI